MLQSQIYQAIEELLNKASTELTEDQYGDLLDDLASEVESRLSKLEND